MSNTDFEENVDAGPSDDVLDSAADIETEVDATSEAEDEEVDAQGGEEEVAPRRNRANETIRELRARAQEERAHRERLDRELMELRAAQQAQQQRADPDREAERLALMTPDERADYKLNNALNQIRRENALTSFKNEDQSDKARFEAKAVTDKVYAKYADRVEQERLKYMREQNTVIPREELLKWIVGQDVLQNRGRLAAKQGKQGKQNIQRQQAPLANGRGNAQANRRGAADSPAKRLEGVLI